MCVCMLVRLNGGRVQVREVTAFIWWDAHAAMRVLFGTNAYILR